MSWVNHEFKESGVRIGLGTGLCYMDKSVGDIKYHILSAVEGMPEVTGSNDTISFSSTTNIDVSNAQGKRTLENPEITLPYNLDNIMLLNRLTGKEINIAYIDFDDFTGLEFTGTVSYRVGEITTDGIKVLILTITTTSLGSTVTTDLYPIYQDTVQFGQGIPTSVVIEGTATTQTITVDTVQENATISVSIVEGTGVATASATSKIISITTTQAGSCILEVTASLANYASYKKYIKVIVTA